MSVVDALRLPRIPSEGPELASLPTSPPVACTWGFLWRPAFGLLEELPGQPEHLGLCISWVTLASDQRMPRLEAPASGWVLTRRQCLRDETWPETTPGFTPSPPCTKAKAVGRRELDPGTREGL